MLDRIGGGAEVSKWRNRKVGSAAPGSPRRNRGPEAAGPLVINSRLAAASWLRPKVIAAISLDGSRKARPVCSHTNIRTGFVCSVHRHSSCCPRATETHRNRQSKASSEGLEARLSLRWHLLTRNQPKVSGE